MFNLLSLIGNDPATDMRGCGFLGLLQLLHLVSSTGTAGLAREIYRLSLHDLQVQLVGIITLREFVVDQPILDFHHLNTFLI